MKSEDTVGLEIEILEYYYVESRQLVAEYLVHGKRYEAELVLAREDEVRRVSQNEERNEVDVRVPLERFSKEPYVPGRTARYVEHSYLVNYHVRVK